jgi:hypothetical protein
MQSDFEGIPQGQLKKESKGCLMNPEQIKEALKNSMRT